MGYEILPTHSYASNFFFEVWEHKKKIEVRFIYNDIAFPIVNCGQTNTGQDCLLNEFVSNVLDSYMLPNLEELCGA